MLRVPGSEDFTQSTDRFDTLVESLASENGELDFGDVEPASVLGRVMDLEALGEQARFGGCERLVERSRRVSIEVVQDEHDLFRVWVLDVGQAPEKVSEIDSSAMLGALGDDATFEGLDGEEDVRRPRAPILVIDSSGPARR